MDPSNSSDVNTASGDANSPSTGNYGYSVHEAVGVFSIPEALERAIDELEVSGFDRATLSVLASEGAIKDRVGHLYRSVAEIEDNRHVPQRAFVETDSRVEGTTAAIGIPCYVGSVAGAGVTAVGFGSAMAATVAGAVVGGVVGAGLGAVLAGAMIRRHVHEVSEQLAEGGLVLWVSLRDDDAERRALHILANAGGRDVHVHEFEREWTLKDRPLSDVQFDPFLWWPGDTSKYP
jgi:outer membrane lipoprotein SlyB